MMQLVVSDFYDAGSPISKKEEYVEILTPTISMSTLKEGRGSNRSMRRSSRVTRLDTNYSNDPYISSGGYRTVYGEKPRRTIQQIFGQNSRSYRESRQRQNSSPEEESKVYEDYRIPQSSFANNILFRGLGALGVVCGDIGTSPIYTLGPVFERHLRHDTIPDRDDIIGAISNLIWLLCIVVCIKYCGFVLSASFNGEGGTFALYENLISYKHRMSKLAFSILTGLCCCAVGLFIGDSTIGPAISVLSALEGICQVQPLFKDYVVYVGVIIIVLLFALQHKGTAIIGLVFGPILLIWFIFIFSLGIYSLNTNGIDILHALNPYSALKYWWSGNYSGRVAFTNTANIILSLTGAEVLYADMGHFGRCTITTMWYLVVFPALLLQYLGQGAFLLHFTTPGSLDNYSPTAKHQLFDNLANSPFWTMIPKENSAVYFYYFSIILSTAASVITSQSVITGSFTLMNQASALGFIPKLKVVYTNYEQKGHVYIGSVCFIQGVICTMIVIIFKHSTKLSAAFGTAVTSVFLITTIILFFYIAPLCWKYRPIQYIPLFLIFGSIDVVMWTSAMAKIRNGAWIPLVVALGIILIMASWCRASKWVSKSWEGVVKKSWKNSPISFDEGRTKGILIKDSVSRCSGVGIFLSPSQDLLPLSLTILCSRLYAVPKCLLIVTVKTGNEPFVAAWDRIEFEEIEKDECCAYFVIIHHGWAEPLSSLNILEFLRAAALDEDYKYIMPQPIIDRFASLSYDNDYDSAHFMSFDEPLSIFTTTTKVRAANGRNIMEKCIIWLYLTLKNVLSPTAVEYFHLPPGNTTEIGVCISA